MSKVVIKLGNSKNPSNHIRFKDPGVSLDHLEIEYLDKHHLLINDMDSTNGTFVNGTKFLQVKVVASDIIQVGQTKVTGAWLIQEVEKIINQNKVVFYNEFLDLKVLFEEFDKKNNRLTYKYFVKVQMLRFGTIGLLLVLFIVLGPKLGVPDYLRVGIGLMGGIIGFLLAEKLFSRAGFQDKKRSLREEYSQKLQCPKCKLTLVNNSYKYWKEQRICPRCQANWVE